MAKAAKRLFICLDNAGYEVSLERRKIKLNALAIFGSSTNRKRAIFIRRSALSPQICLSRRVAPSCTPPNNRFERSQGRIFGAPRRGSMIGINQLRLLSQPRVAQPHCQAPD